MEMWSISNDEMTTLGRLVCELCVIQVYTGCQKTSINVKKTTWTPRFLKIWGGHTVKKGRNCDLEKKS